MSLVIRKNIVTVNFTTQALLASISAATIADCFYAQQGFEMKRLKLKKPPVAPAQILAFADTCYEGLCANIAECRSNKDSQVLLGAFYKQTNPKGRGYKQALELV